MSGTDDDAWLDQLRDALAAPAEPPPDPPAGDLPRLSAHPAPSAQPATEPFGDTGTPDPDDDIRTALLQVAERLGSLETAVRAVTDPAAGPAVPTGHVAALLDELRRRVGELEELHRRTVDELAADRRQLVDEAVSEIRTLLFGE